MEEGTEEEGVEVAAGATEEVDTATEKVGGARGGGIEEVEGTG